MNYASPTLYCASDLDLLQGIQGFKALLIARSAIYSGIKLIQENCIETTLDEVLVMGFQETLTIGGIGSDILDGSIIVKDRMLVELRSGDYPNGEGNLVFLTPQEGVDGLVRTLRSYGKSQKASELSLRLRSRPMPIPDQPDILRLVDNFAGELSGKTSFSSDSDSLPFREILYFPEYWGGYGCHFYAFTRDEVSFKVHLEKVADRHGHVFREMALADLPMF